MYVAGDHFFFMRRRPPRSTRPDTLFPYPTRVRSRLWLARPPREGQMSPSHSARRQALARFAANRAAMVGLVLLTVIVLLAVIVPMAWPYGLEDASLERALRPPSFADFHWFEIGRAHV